jgi:hypothetical protein
MLSLILHTVFMAAKDTIFIDIIIHKIPKLELFHSYTLKNVYEFNSIFHLKHCDLKSVAIGCKIHPSLQLLSHRDFCNQYVLRHRHVEVWKLGSKLITVPNSIKICLMYSYQNLKLSFTDTPTVRSLLQTHTDTHRHTHTHTHISL